VDLKHVALYNDDLAHAIQDKPGDTLPLFETAATRAAEKILFPISNDGKREEGERTVPDVQIMIKSGMNMLQFRDLTVSQPSCLPTATHYQYYPGRYIYQTSQNTWNYHIYIHAPIEGHKASFEMPRLRFHKDNACPSRARWGWWRL
jgi:hypothetical protein